MDDKAQIAEMQKRIEDLEAQVQQLFSKQTKAKKIRNDKKVQPGTAEIYDYIVAYKAQAKEKGLGFIIVTSRDIHTQMKLSHRYPSVCNAMRQAMSDSDEILHSTPSGNSSTLKIKYYL